MKLNIKKLRDDAKLPTKAHIGDAGMDIYTVEEIIFAPHSQASIPTGISFEIPEGYVGLIWDKSGMAFKNGFKSMGGVIDSSFRGELMISLYNTKNESQTLEKGQKVAQMIIQKFEDCDIVEVDELSDTTRGTDWAGSTGHK